MYLPAARDMFRDPSICRTLSNKIRPIPAPLASFLTKYWLINADVLPILAAKIVPISSPSKKKITYCELLDIWLTKFPVVPGLYLILFLQAY